jgi:acyl-CoA synthetase (AMP-forming)/AMP-acid ligase II
LREAKQCDAFPVLPELKSLMLSSSPVSLRLRREVLTHITPQLYIVYGSNEFGLISIAMPGEIETYPNTVGRVSGDVILEIHDSQGNILPAGEVGEIFVKREGETLSATYLDAPEATQRRFRNGGYYTGDMGRLMGDGHLLFEGRADDMMIFTGGNIYPIEIESVLERYPKVEEAAAFPLLLEGEEQVPFAAVTLNGKVSEKELLAWCRTHLGWRAPLRVLIADRFPKNPAGKILKRELAKKTAELLTR